MQKRSGGASTGSWRDPLAEPVSLADFLEAALTKRDDPATIERSEQEALFLGMHIFVNLTILHPSWDSAHIAHFNANDFHIVLERCSKAGIKIFGVEAFSADGMNLGVNIPTCAADLSHLDFVESLSNDPSLSFCASYGFDGVSLNRTEDTTIKV
jgi:hypothetical protein